MSTPDASETSQTPEAFGRACLAHAEAIRRYARVSLPSKQDAEDLTQEVLARALQVRGQFTGADLGGWLYGIARNAIAQFYRKRQLDHSSQRQLEQQISVELPERPEAAFCKAELRAAMLAALERLEEREREALRLKFSMAYDNRSIARLLQVTPGFLGVLVFRALEKLREDLKERGHVE